MAVKCKHYAFTIWPNNLNGKFSSLQEWFSFAQDRTNGVKYLVFQQEIAPTTQQVHIQGFVSWQTQKTPATTANHFGGIDKECFQKMKKGSTPWANKVYCTKDSDRVPGTEFFEFGEQPLPNGKEDPDKSKLDQFIDLMKTGSLAQAIDAMPSTYVRNCNGLKELDAIYTAERIPRIRQVNVIVCWGPTGTGKSWFAAGFDPDNSYSLPDVTAKDRLNFGNYKGQRTLVIEEFQGEIPCNSLLTILDGYRREYNTKGGWVWSAWDTVIITSNTYPGYWYDDRRDNWGPTGGSPLQRRINSLMEFKGRWPGSTVSNNGGIDIPVSMLSTRAEMEAFDLPLAESPVPSDSADAEAAASHTQNHSSVPETGSRFQVEKDEDLFGFTTGEYQPPVVEKGLTVDDLLEDWERQDALDEAAFQELEERRQEQANDFIRNALGDLSPLVFEHDSLAENELLNGEAGDGEPDNGRLL